MLLARFENLAVVVSMRFLPFGPQLMVLFGSFGAV